ncbi:MAG: dihydrofolate reductase family protein [Brevinema sp.]
MKAQVILYIAQSLDGYIADLDGGIQWLPQNMGEKMSQFYEEFINKIDIILMGRNTYDQIITELSPNTWPYPPRIDYFVWTSRPLVNQKNTDSDITLFLEQQKKKEKKNIWILGGGHFVHQWIEKDLIDEYMICTAPIILGEGIKLFPQTKNSIPLTLTNLIQEDNMVLMHYKKFS